MIQVDVRHLVPEFLLCDKNGFAIAKAIEKGMQIFLQVIQDGIETATDLDKMPEWRLDEVAWALNVGWYDLDYSEEEKRKTIAQSRNVYRALGTKASVQTAISAIYPDTVVSEWFEYGGEPYHFRLLLDSTFENVDIEKHRRVLEKVEFYKNLRSVLDEVEYYNTGGTVAIYSGAAFLGSEITDAAAAKNFQEV